jgi:hypothetical protein
MPFYDWDDFAHLPITFDIQSFIRLNGFGGTYYIRSCQGRLCVAIDQRPAAWMEHYHQSNYLYYDPIAYASYSENTAFFWDDILQKTQRGLLAAPRAIIFPFIRAVLIFRSFRSLAMIAHP